MGAERVPTNSVVRKEAPQAARVVAAYFKLIRIEALMARTEGREDLVVALIDGPIVAGLAALPYSRICTVSPAAPYCSTPDSTACEHGTFVAGILLASRNSLTPGLCPGCTVLVYPIFTEPSSTNGRTLSASAEKLAAAIVACVEAGARIVNLSLSVLPSTSRGARELGLALDMAARRGVIVVAAAGNDGTVGSGGLAIHPCVIPVTSCDLAGAALDSTNLGATIGRRGLAAPGSQVTSLRPDGSYGQKTGTSAAAPFVTGSIALLWSAEPHANAQLIRESILRPHAGRRKSITPPLLDAGMAYDFMRAQRR
jgi:subtilisin family serine protease